MMENGKMICRSCGNLYMRKNAQEVCQNCYTGGKKREKMFYTKKVWKKFSWGTKEKLTEDYEVILEYPKPMKEKVKEKLKSVVKRSEKGKRKERRAKLGKMFGKIAKGMTSKKGSNKLGKLSRVLNDSNHNTNQLVSKHRRPRYIEKTKHDDKFDGLMGRGKQDYSALISRKGGPKF